MLHIFFGDMDDMIYNTSVYFKFNYRQEWLQDLEIKQMIRDVDQSTVLGNGAIDSPVMGVIAPTALSGGVKTLLLIAYDHTKIFNASPCGDNCAPWILKIAENKKVVINLRHLMDFGKSEFKIRVLNTGKIVKKMGDLVAEAGEFV